MHDLVPEEPRRTMPSRFHVAGMRQHRVRDSGICAQIWLALFGLPSCLADT